MRIIKKADIRKNEILDAAEELFTEHGFDKTSTNMILEKAGIARGTLYYHFKSKEEIMDALIERTHKDILAAVREKAEMSGVSIYERLQAAFAVMSIRQSSPSLVEHINKPQNALMHQKVEEAMMRDLPPIIAEIVADGIKENIFDTKYPLEAVEAIFCYTNFLFSQEEPKRTKEEKIFKSSALIYQMERLLGAKEGSLSYMMNLTEN